MSSETHDSPRVGVIGLLTAATRAVRPRQWTKNLIVVGAPVAAGVLFQPEVLRALFIGFIAFSFLASSLYLVNDMVDAEADRIHPTKRMRPIASGALPVPVAVAMAVVLGVFAFALATMALPVGFVLVLLAYAVNTTLYSIWGKNEANVDMLQVAIGFVLRAVAGAVAVDIPMSQWFLGVAMFGSLFMVAGKRTSEKTSNGGSASQRSVLARYSVEYLEQVMTIAACALLITYALWAFGDSASPIGAPWDIISLAPFTYSVLHYLQVAEAGQAEEPERLALTDRRLQFGAALWILVIVTGVYL